MYREALRHCKLSYVLRFFACGSCFLCRSTAHVGLLTEQYAAVVRKMIEDLDRPISELSLVAVQHVLRLTSLHGHWPTKIKGLLCVYV